MAIVSLIRGDQEISRHNPAILFDGRQLEGDSGLGNTLLILFFDV